MTTSASPAGFALSKRSSNLLDLLGPLYECGTGSDYRVGLRVDDRRTTTRGFCHGAVVRYLKVLVAARLGDWLEAGGHIDRVGKNLAHSSGTITANGTPVLRATGSFQVTEAR